MTAQIDDTLVLRGSRRAIAGQSSPGLFDPARLGLTPIAPCTACWRGYQAVFGLDGNRLVLGELHVNLDGEVGGAGRPAINGVRPTGPGGGHDWFNHHYACLGLPVEYSGGLLLADGFIRELYVHNGIHPAWKYRHVTELLFDRGVLTAELDRSALMAETRQRFTGRWVEAAILDHLEKELGRRY
jgi:hypothetical protein